MANYTLIKNGNAINTIVADDSFIQSMIESGTIDSAELVVPPPPPVLPHQWDEGSFRGGLSLEEKVKWDEGSVPEMVTVQKEFGMGMRNRAQTTSYINLLVTALAISQETADRILALDPDPEIQ